MSVSYNTFVGPYIEVYNPEKDSVYEYHSCPKKGCKNHSKEISSKFCPTCGSEIKLTSRPSKKRIDFDCYLEFENSSLEEVMNEYKPKDKEDSMYFIGGRKDSIGLTIDGNYTTAHEISPDVPGMEINNFQLRCKDEITKLRKVFGKDNVKVKWGVLVWCN